MIPHLVLDQSTPRARGEAHGVHFRKQIHTLYEIRRELTLGRTDLGNEDKLLALAKLHLPVAERYDADLFAELEGVAAGSDISLEALVVLNHYTDLRDLSRAELDDGGCSVLYAPGPPSVLGQTWDMHGSATDFVCVLEVKTAVEHTVLFSITGCLGMTGLNTHGLGMTINNLNSLDAKVGILWPTFVRKCLQTTSAKAARAELEAARLGSGHHYIFADGEDFFGFETSGQKKKLTQSGAREAHCHTNHCLDDEMAATAKVLSTSTTHARYEKLQAMGAPPNDARAIFDAFEIVSNGQTADDPHKVATCGAFVMDLSHKRALACQGPPGPSVDSLDIEVSK